MLNIESTAGVARFGRDFEPCDIQSLGHYHKVAIIGKAERLGWHEIRTRLIGLVKPEAPSQKRIKELAVLQSIASGVLGVGVITRENIASLPNGLSHYDKIRLASVFAIVTGEYYFYKARWEKRFRRDLPYDCGLSLSDLVEVMPVATSARILYAASEPDVALDVAKGVSFIQFDNADDTQVSAVEAVALLPKDSRRRVFEEMSKLGRGTQGRAYKFFAFLVANWADPMSNYGAQQLIRRNLPDAEAEEKIQEVASEFSELGAFLRQG